MIQIKDQSVITTMENCKDNPFPTNKTLESYYQYTYLYRTWINEFITHLRLGTYNTIIETVRNPLLSNVRLQVFIHVYVCMYV